MPDHPTFRRKRRTSFLTGAGIALVTTLVTAATAQSIDATSVRSAVNQQNSQNGANTADASRTSAFEQIVAATGSSATVASNTITATARDNSATTSLALDTTGPADQPASSALSIDTFAVGAKADTLVASSQRISASPVQTNLLGSDADLSTGTAASTNLTVASNDFEATALGNQASDELALGNGAASGAGIVTLQYGDAASAVSANNRGATQLIATGAAKSTLTLDDNLTSAAATGNGVGDALSVAAGSFSLSSIGAAASPASSVQGGDAAVDALYANFGKQVLPNQVSAVAGSSPGGFTLGIAGALSGSSVDASGNGLVAAGVGNDSSRTLDLNAGDIAAPGSGDAPAAIANLTGVQRVLGANVGATTDGGVAVGIGGSLSGSDVTVSQNVLRATATGNRADGNLLTVDANALDSGAAPGLGWGTVGTAMTGSDGTASTTGAFSVQNVQDVAGGNVSAAMTSGQVGVYATGAVDHASLSAQDNGESVAATGNSAVNGATVQASMLRSRYDLNNAQTVDGNVRTQVGAPGDRAGVKIEPVGDVEASTLTVAGNSLTGTAVGSTASNSVAITGNSVADGSGHQDATAGDLPAGYGAAADIALANYQKFGVPLAAGAATSSVISNVTGKFAIGGDATTNADSLSVDGNSQRDTAVANTALDRVTLTATAMPAAASPAAGSALSSSQYGEGLVGANSDMLVVARGGVDNSSVSMSGNSNQAVAAINDVDNGLTVSAVQLGSVTGGPAHADVGNLGSATIVGDHVLSSTQFAAGSVGAAARTKLVNGDADATMGSSHFAVTDNTTIADVSANHAVNAVSVTGQSGSGDAGLANSQMSDATVSSSASVGGTLGLSGSPTTVAIYGSTATIQGNGTQAVARGNSADNSLSLEGPALPGAGSSSGNTGAFDTTAAAPGLLVNGQSNYGAVTASAGGSYGIPLNAAGSVLSSSLGVTGNTAVASAYGNVATNQLTVSASRAAPGVMLTNVQTNSGPVTAQVTAATFAGRASQLGASSLSISGNQLAASATGNLATSTITAAR
ncbi:MAG: hypothetical protein JWR80_4226 [Bradyrhizobium sp.]|nr:hypothetical protein [Bradyrhizobium sp.]